MFRNVLCATLAVVMTATIPVLAAWRVEIESKIVEPGSSGVTVDFIAAWERPLGGVTIPVVVRQLDPGTFWTGSLPYHTSQGSHGVSWDSLVTAGPAMRLVYPGPFPGLPCHTDADTNHYDGVSPDYFGINFARLTPVPEQPNGVTLVTISFDVTDIPGQFEFDTACFTHGQDRIYIVDYAGLNYGGQVQFTKGVITIAPAPRCDCSHQGDVNNDGHLNIADLVFLIRYALKGPFPEPWTDPACPCLNRADWNCNGKINLADIVGMVRYLVRFPAPGPANPCAHLAAP